MARYTVILSAFDGADRDEHIEHVNAPDALGAAAKAEWGIAESLREAGARGDDGAYYIHVIAVYAGHLVNLVDGGAG